MKKLIIILLTSFMVLGFFGVYAENKHLIFETGEDGKEYWYENGVKQGVYGQKGNVWYDNTERGREIYDPTSNAWYWLDCVYGGAKAVNKEVFMPYVYQDEDNWINDNNKVKSIVDESNTYTEFNITANMSEQVYAAIKNKTGKWVRYDENGKMIKGWYTVEEKDRQYYPNQVGNTYYYDYKTGLMAKGKTVINNREYYFDEITGVLKNDGHTHNWVHHDAVYNTVHHDTVVEKVWVESGENKCHQETVWKEEGGWTWAPGVTFAEANGTTPETHPHLYVRTGAWWVEDVCEWVDTSHWEEVVQGAWDEQVLATPEYDECTVCGARK